MGWRPFQVVSFCFLAMGGAYAGRCGAGKGAAAGGFGAPAALRCAALRCALPRCAVLCRAALCYAIICYAIRGGEGTAAGEFGAPPCRHSLSHFGFPSASFWLLVIGKGIDHARNAGAAHAHDLYLFLFSGLNVDMKCASPSPAGGRLGRAGAARAQHKLFSIFLALAHMKSPPPPPPLTQVGGSGVLVQPMDVPNSFLSFNALVHMSK